jgi:hypothetical protein
MGLGLHRYSLVSTQPTPSEPYRDFRVTEEQWRDQDDPYERNAAEAATRPNPTETADLLRRPAGGPPAGSPQEEAAPPLLRVLLLANCAVLKRLLLRQEPKPLGWIPAVKGNTLIIP